MTDESKVILNEKGEAVCFVGPDATRYFQAGVLWTGLGLIKKGIKPSRGVTKRGMLQLAGHLMGKTYKINQIDQARDDIRVWMNAMRSALPVEVRHSQDEVHGQVPPLPSTD